MKKKFEILPSVDAVLSKDSIADLFDKFGRDNVKSAVQTEIDKLRKRILENQNTPAADREKLITHIIGTVSSRLQVEFSASLKPVINATGIVLHTGLGRAPLSLAAQENIAKIMQGYSNIELELENGKRGNRTDHVRQLLTRLTGSEDALVVNNNAAAVFLALNTLAFAQEAIISRGQLVEIGGSFRIPDVMAKSGVIMREVGTTNKTKLSDYKAAINENTGAIVVAHTSNYRVLGFTHEPELSELCELAHNYNLPVLHDLGGGVLVDLKKFNLPYEPLVQDSIAAGADVITFSGDKVLGGPQSGILVGKKKYIEDIFKNPIMRAVRVDKLIYAALEPTLLQFFSAHLTDTHTTLHLLTEKPASIQKRAEKIINMISAQQQENIHFEIMTCFGQVGSGALPLEKLESRGIAITSCGQSAEKMSYKLRTGKIPVIGYIQDDKVILDIRTVLDSDVEKLVGMLNEL